MSLGEVIHIVRDGRAVALSLHANRLRIAHPHASAQERSQVLENVARYWTKILDSVEAERGSMDIFELRYKDFCLDTRGSLRKMLEHVGLSPERFPYERCPASLTATNERWIGNASRGAIETIERIQGQWLRRYGYL
jgi:hypothetical protein